MGVLAVSVHECHGQNLAATPDPEPFPEHVVIDFRACHTLGKIKKAAQRLKAAAMTRGWQYQQAEASG